MTPSFSEQETVILYCHGNGSNRSQQHRVELYKVLLSLGFYVLAFDYRGYGDSTNIKPSETSVVSDARAALQWVTAKLGDKVSQPIRSQHLNKLTNQKSAFIHIDQSEDSMY